MNIYEYLKINYNIEDTYIFDRDYIINPIKKMMNIKYHPYEIPTKNDFKYLYIEKNLPRDDISKIFNVSKSIIEKWVRLFGLYKPTELSTHIIKSVKLERYGDENYNNKEKRHNTNLKKYGVKCYNNREKYRDTCLEKYGSESTLHIKEVENKARQTCLEKYGCEYYTQTNEYKQLYKPTINVEKSKQTKLERYGDENYNNKEKYKETCLEKYGVNNYFQSSNYKKIYTNDFVKNIVNKRFNTMKNNGTCGKSREEDIIYNKLVERYREVIRQYKSEKYPFPCDYYIPNEDLYIEYQGYWMHSNEPYIGSDEQITKIKLWESKESIQYKRAIDTWTNKDVIKRQTAKANNLNWIEFFNINEFNEWFNKE